MTLVVLKEADDETGRTPPQKPWAHLWAKSIAA